MNVLEVERKDFIRGDELKLATLTNGFQKLAFFQDFIYLVLPTGGIFVFKDRYDVCGTGFIFAP